MVPILFNVKMKRGKHANKWTMRGFDLSWKVLEETYWDELETVLLQATGGFWERQIRFTCASLSLSLDEESLLTLVVETEGILNSHPLVVEITSNSTSDLLLSSWNILTIKSKAVMPPPENFSRPDLFCWKRCCHFQHVANEFWPRWRKEYLQSLQVHTKWQNGK